MKTLTGLVVSLLAGSAFAGGMAQTHDGFFLNLGIGLGAGTQEWKGLGGTSTYDGSAGFFNFRIGG